MSSYQYRKSHCGDKTILRPSYLHNGISYTVKTTSSHWTRALMTYPATWLTHCSLVHHTPSYPCTVPIMPCYLTAPRHYLTQCCLITSEIVYHSPEGNFARVLNLLITKMSLIISNSKLPSHLPGANDLIWKIQQQQIKQQTRTALQ